MERETLIRQLFYKFQSELLWTLKPYPSIEEAADYLESLITFIKGSYNHVDPIPHLGWVGNPFDSDAFIRQHILLKHKDKAKPFLETSLRLYLERPIHAREALFKLNQVTESILTDEEFDHYIYNVMQFIQRRIEKICTEPFDNAKIALEPEGELTGFKSVNKEYTRSRQTLMFYYMLKVLGILRVEGSLRKHAQFAHALFGYPIDNIDNSDIYKKLKQAPLLKKEDKANLKDLEFVRDHFKMIELTAAVELVQKEIDSIKRG